MLTPTNQSEQALALPEPRVPIHIRPAVAGDVAFMDSLQKMHTKQVGWMPTGQLEGHVAKGHVLVAEAVSERLGYCIAVDKYFKREDTGIVYQMNVKPGSQRGYVGAMLLKAMFERWPWGVRLCCCWCAQDIAANHFWEAMGFVPLAFRTGSAKRSRVHIFWQKRIRRGDVATPWWYPSQTGSGSLREDRLVLPIAPGTHWSDAKPLVLPGMEREEEVKRLPRERKSRGAQQKAMPAVQKKAVIVTGGLRFGMAPAAKVEQAKVAPEPRRKKKNDPRLVAAARELRDRWLEQVNTMPLLGSGKYDVSRVIEGAGEAGVVAEHVIAALPGPGGEGERVAEVDRAA